MACAPLAQCVCFILFSPFSFPLYERDIFTFPYFYIIQYDFAAKKGPRQPPIHVPCPDKTLLYVNQSTQRAVQALVVGCPSHTVLFFHDAFLQFDTHDVAVVA